MTTYTKRLTRNIQSLPLWQTKWKTAVLLISLIFLLWVGLKAWRIGTAVNSLFKQQEAVQTLANGGLANIDPEGAEATIQTIRQDVLVLRDETAVFLPLTTRLGWVPKVGPLLISAPQLIEMADAGTETAVYAVESLKPLLLILQSDQSGSPPLPQLINALAEARPGLAQASQSLEKVAQARANIDNLAEFPQRLKPLFTQADEWLPIAQDSLRFVQIMPDIMGQNGRRTYLILAQNEDEIRATGGFISGVGTLTVENGDIQSLSFQDASTYDLQSFIENSSAYSYPPQPLYELMGSEYLLFRDANYWPDFPYSAQKAIELYQLASPESEIDGLFAIDQQFMALLVAATGPIAVQENEPPITAVNMGDSFRNSFNIKEGQTTGEWFQNRKQFLSTFSSAILNKITTDFASIDPVTLIKNMHWALSTRHLQLYLTEPQETAVLDSLNWDGRLENQTNQDFLLVLDTNMGFNKTNMNIERETQYEVDLSSLERPQASLSVQYTHTSAANGQPCLQETSYANAPTYQELADQCYFNYLRVYAPPTSELLDASTHTIPEGILLSGLPWNSAAVANAEFANFATFNNFMMIPRGESVTTSMRYTLPQTVVQTEDGQYIYQLWLQKQAGMAAETVTVIISLPQDRKFINSLPQPVVINQDNTVQFTIELTSDSLISVTFN